MKVSIVDYGAGNLPSVERALQSLGAETERATSPEQLASAKAIVLPGVGHFAAFVGGLEEKNVIPALRKAFDAGVPILGICLGLQAMFASSEEAPGEQGLGFFPQTIRALPKTVKSPHIGWNQVNCTHTSKLLSGIPKDAYFYFAHSFAAPGDGNEAVAVCDHGIPFAAVIEQQNLFGVQFHPEKSGEVGSRILRNFLEAAR
jgi:imidazole glycerol phosphate synthase glutamine amidotransferase subunit